MTPFRVLTVMTPDKRHLRAGIWELSEGTQKRAICVLLNGHTEFLEKYQEVADELRDRGFEVVSLDWRGTASGTTARMLWSHGSISYRVIFWCWFLSGITELVPRTFPAALAWS